MPPTILAIDTSGPTLSIAAQCGNNPIVEKIHSEAWGHMENVFPFIDELLTSQNASIRNVTTFLVNRGPGSFTGLRIAFSVLKGFAHAAKVDCFGADSMEVTAEKIPVTANHLAICMDAFRSKFYVRTFIAKSNHWKADGESRALTFEETITQLPHQSLIAGDALKRHRLVFDAAKDKRFKISEENFWHPRASSLIRMMEHNPESLKKLVSSDDFLPVYLRQSEPEERKAELKT